MKGKFEVPNTSLLRLKDSLSEHKPYIIMIVSSTGIDRSGEYTGHQPTRVFVQEYVYDNKLEDYTKSITFDKLVRCSQEALDVALSNISNYDVFAKAGIDKDAYLKGDNVIEPDEFRKEFSRYMSGVEEGAVVVANNTSFCISMLDKIECADELKVLASEKRILDQPTLSKAYLKEHGIDSQRSTLEVLRNYITNDKDNTEKIIGADNRAAIINSFVAIVGRECGYIASEYKAMENKLVADYFDDLSKRGKSVYQNLDIEGKIKVLEKQGVVSEDILNREYDCHLNRLYDLLDGKTNAKGVIFMQCATTGFGAYDIPIQFAAICMPVEDGKFITDKAMAYSVDIQADNRSLAKVRDLIEKGKFNAFKYTGINQEAYEQGFATGEDGKASQKPLLSEDEALARINRFFEKFPPSEYAVITNGQKDGKSFTQNALSKLGNLEVVTAPFIDFTQVIKEYSYVSFYDNKYNKNVLIDIENGIDSFSLENVAKVHNFSVTNSSCIKKCSAIAQLTGLIAQQHKVMTLGREEAETILQKIEAEVSLENTTSVKNETPVVLNQPLVQNTDISSQNNDLINEGYGNIIENVDKEIDEVNQEAELAIFNKENKDAEISHSIESFENNSGIVPIPADMSNHHYIPDDNIKDVTGRNEPEVHREQAHQTISERRPVQPLRERMTREDITRQHSSNEVRANSGGSRHISEAPLSQKNRSEAQQQTINPDVMALIVAINKQTEAMNKQTEAIISQNAMLMQTVTEQSLRLEKTNDVLVRAVSTIADLVSVNGIEQEQSHSVVERLESIKDEIAALYSEDIPKASVGHLQTANSLISKAQNTIDRDITELMANSHKQGE